MMHLLAGQLHRAVGIVFFLLYAYQLVFLLVPWLLRRRKKEPHPMVSARRFAVLISARNEEAVIGHLLDSVRGQDYPADKIHPFVVADNCTDRTAAVAAAHGATVYTRQNRERVGKGYALDFLLERLKTEHPEGFDAYLVLDADNLLSPDYLAQMNRTLAEGFSVVTGYRASKNYTDNWISAGYGLWFLRDCQQLNRPRYMLGVDAMISGTGFAFTQALLEKQGGGWPYHTMTEDMEFNAVHLAAGDRIGYCEGAVLYDEQPVTFRQSWRQRMRWAKGYLQVLRRNGKGLVAGMGRGSFSCFDLVASIFPAFFLTLVELAVCAADTLGFLVQGIAPWPALLALFQMLGGAYGTLLVLGGVTLCTEWRRIPGAARKKAGYFLLFPLFMLTYIPIAVAALFCRVEWKPVAHTRAIPLQELQGNDGG